MINIRDLSLSFGGQVLFENVNLKFTKGNCYGVIGANGAGKSSFLKVLSSEIEPSSGQIVLPDGMRLCVLKQDQHLYDDCPVIETVIRGHEELFSIIEERDSIYEKDNFSEEDGLRVADLETQFAELNGWEAEAEAEQLIVSLGVKDSVDGRYMRDLSAEDKVRVLLAQALFSKADILVMDEPTNNLDGEAIIWLENFLQNHQSTIIIVSHDRHFMDNVCVYMVDIDRGTMTLYPGNYSFWKEASTLAVQQKMEQNKSVEAKKKELQKFVQRFSAQCFKGTTSYGA